MAPGVPNCLYREIPPSISFSGSGFMATYQIGVAQCFQNYAPWILRAAPCVLGASAGSLVAAAVVCDMSLNNIRDEMLQFAKKLTAITLGPLNPSVNVFHWLECILRQYIPPDAHQRAHGRLAVAMTRITDGKHIVISEYQSKEDVIQALLCSCFVPGYCGVQPPSFKGEHYVDGGFTSMQPVLSQNHTLTVSPFSGDMDICPADTPCMWDMVVSGTTLRGNMANSFRVINALYPMALETLEQAYHSGYKDANHFLLTNAIAPYSMVIHHVSLGHHNYNQIKMRPRVEATKEEEEHVKLEKATSALKSFTENKCVKTDCSTEHESTCKSTSNVKMESRKETSLYFDLITNVLLGNLVTYMSMFSLPMRVFSFLLLPLTLLFYTILQSRQRLELWFRLAPEWMFWSWHGVRHFCLFFYKIVVCTIRKNIQDRTMPIILLFQWLNIHTKYESIQRKNHSTLFLKFPSFSHSEDRKMSTNLPSHHENDATVTELLH